MTGKKSKLNDRYEVEPDGSSTSLGLERRIEAVADRLGSREKAASIGGISSDQLGKYINGVTKKPAFAPLVRMAKAAGVRLEWLAWGEGPQEMRGSIGEPGGEYQVPRADAVNMTILRGVIRGVRRIEEQEGEQLSPEGFAKMVGVLYEYFLEDQWKSTDEDQVSQDAGRVFHVIRKAG